MRFLTMLIALLMMSAPSWAAVKPANNKKPSANGAAKKKAPAVKKAPVKKKK